MAITNIVMVISGRASRVAVRAVRVVRQEVRAISRAGIIRIIRTLHPLPNATDADNPV